MQYLSAPVVKGHKGWGGSIEEGTAAQFADYVKMVDEFQVGAPALLLLLALSTHFFVSMALPVSDLNNNLGTQVKRLGI